MFRLIDPVSGPLESAENRSQKIDIRALKSTTIYVIFQRKRARNRSHNQRGIVVSVRPPTGLTEELYARTRYAGCKRPLAPAGSYPQNLTSNPAKSRIKLH